MQNKSIPKKLLNKYTGEILYCDNPDDVIKEKSYTFIWAYTSSNPYRKFLVNKEAFSVVNK